MMSMSIAHAAYRTAESAWLSVMRPGARSRTCVEGLGDKVISLAGKVYLANVGAGMMSENFVVDKDRLQIVMEGMHDFIFNKV